MRKLASNVYSYLRKENADQNVVELRYGETNDPYIEHNQYLNKEVGYYIRNPLSTSDS